MYKVLLVDDEINILEGIAAMIDWKSCGTNLVAKAYNGQMAYEMILNEQPDIVLCDIKMPGIDGLELIEKVHKPFPYIKFVILSGHDEFDFAKTAMQYSVKHYLLKPSNEHKIQETLKQVVQELNEEKQRESFIRNIRSDLEKVMPKAKEQFLKEFITNKTYGRSEWDYYSQLFGIHTTARTFRLIVFMIEGDHDFEQIFVLKKIATEAIKTKQRISLSTTIGKRVVILLENGRFQELMAELKKTREVFGHYYQLGITISVSNAGGIEQLRQLYSETLECLTHRFYLDEGSIITMSDINHSESTYEDLQFDHENLILAMRSGNLEEVKHYLNEFFTIIKRAKYEVNLVKSHALELFMSIIRQAKKDEMNLLFQQASRFQAFETLDQVKDFIVSVSEEVTEMIYDSTKEIQSATIKKVMNYVENHFCDQVLSLSKISNEVFYMNPDYLGKLFKKETGQKFSSYLINLRIEKATELIRNSDQVKVFEVAEEVGFGSNPRYFSQVFKKNTGYTPSEYKNIPFN